MSPTPDLTTFSVLGDRRRHQRYLITASAEYLLQNRRGEVVVRDISNSGLLVQSATILPIGEHIEVRVDWPARVNVECPLTVVIMGKVLGTTSRGTVISVMRYKYGFAPEAPPDWQEHDDEAAKTLGSLSAP